VNTSSTLSSESSFAYCFENGVARLGEDAHQVVLAERIDADDDGQAADEFGNQTILEQVVRSELPQQVGMILFGRPFRTQSPGCAWRRRVLPTMFLEAFEGTTADEQDVRGVDLNEVLVRDVYAHLVAVRWLLCPQ